MFYSTNEKYANVSFIRKIEVEICEQSKVIDMLHCFINSSRLLEENCIITLPEYSLYFQGKTRIWQWNKAETFMEICEFSLAFQSSFVKWRVFLDMEDFHDIFNYGPDFVERMLEIIQIPFW